LPHRGLPYRPIWGFLIVPHIRLNPDCYVLGPTVTYIKGCVTEPTKSPFLLTSPARVDSIRERGVKRGETMKRIANYVAGVMIIALAAGTSFSTGAFAAEPGDGDGTGGDSQYGTFFWIGIGAVVGIATIAIWQGIDDANKKKEKERVREAEEEEIEDFDEYFRSLSGDEAGGSDESETDDDSAPEFVKPLVEPSGAVFGISRILR
jgi:hypothetical protein